MHLSEANLAGEYFLMPACLRLSWPWVRAKASILAADACVKINSAMGGVMGNTSKMPMRPLWPFYIYGIRQVRTVLVVWRYLDR